MGDSTTVKVLPWHAANTGSNWEQQLVQLVPPVNIPKEPGVNANKTLKSRKKDSHAVIDED